MAAASPGFIARHFAQGVSAAALAQAPVMVYDRKDRLPQQWLQAHGLATRTHAPQHFLPSNSAMCAPARWAWAGAYTPRG
jgi:LysR family transcriptional regulator (chromosome initiation inhibitor)